MPTYEYECPDCTHRFERFQGINDDPVAACPECGGKVRRIISAGGGIVFKGPGFYATDYRSGSKPDRPTPSAEGEGPKGKASGEKAKADDAD